MDYTCELSPSNAKRVRMERTVMFKGRAALRQAVQQSCSPTDEKQSKYDSSFTKAQQRHEWLEEYLEQTRNMICNAADMDQINLIVESRSQERARLERMVSNADNELAYHMSQLFCTDM